MTISILKDAKQENRRLKTLLDSSREISFQQKVYYTGLLEALNEVDEWKDCSPMTTEEKARRLEVSELRGKVAQYKAEISRLEEKHAEEKEKLSEKWKNVIAKNKAFAKDRGKRLKELRSLKDQLEEIYGEVSDGDEPRPKPPRFPRSSTAQKRTSETKDQSDYIEPEDREQE